MKTTPTITSYKYTALKIVMVYAGVSVLWILFSDRMLFYFIKDAGLLTKFQMAKGWLFVFATTLLLFFLLQRECKKYEWTETRRRESDYMYQQLAESSQTGIYIHQDDQIVYANNRFAELHGYPLAELLNSDYFNLFAPEDRDKAHRIKAKRLKGDDAPRRYEVKRIRKNGEVFWCETVAVRIEYQGRPAIMGNIVDISERKRAEADQFKNERYKGVVEMAGAICHEMNQPMQSIMGFSELLMLETEAGSPFYAKLMKIREQVERMGQITQKFAKITQYETMDYLKGKIIDLDRAAKQPE